MSGPLAVAGTDIVTRPDFERIRRARHEQRSLERLAAHFEVEATLARQLAGAEQQSRLTLYADLYRRLFDSVADHPQHAARQGDRLERVQAQARLLVGQMSPDAVFVEVGCGDAALTKAVAAHVRSAIGVDVTPILVTGEAPAAFRFVLSDGVGIDLGDETADLVFSNQLMEHLHPDDAMAQLSEIHRLLKPGGRYICSTPNQLTGPHDISVYFAEKPAGFHLREYDHRSLRDIFRAAGFRNISARLRVKGWPLRVPVSLMAAAEMVLERLPRRLRTEIMLSPAASNLLGLTLVGSK